ncbi:MAG: hypothetical protein BGO74_05980 [Burkholderiales bacterium 68-12]|nr:MAG: hypothetical protein BGO74_05980 [Burkholderiales bacterium 68-12]
MIEALFLHVRDQGCTNMRSTMLALLVALDTSTHSNACHDVFALVSSRADGNGQSLAFNWQNRLEITVAPTLHDQRIACSRSHEIDLARDMCLISFLHTKLQAIPAWSLACCTVEVGAQLRRKHRLAGA